MAEMNGCRTKKTPTTSTARTASVIVWSVIVGRSFMAGRIVATSCAWRRLQALRATAAASVAGQVQRVPRAVPRVAAAI